MGYTTNSRDIATSSAPRKWALCTNRAMVGAALSSGNNTETTYRSAYWTVTTGKVNALRLVYANWYISSTGEAEGATQWLRFKAAVETTDGFHPVYFRGCRVGTCEPGGFIVSDPVAIQIAAGEQFWVRTDMFSSYTSEKWPTYNFGTFSSLGESYSIDPRDQVDATGVLNSGFFANVVGPVAIQGLVDADDVADCVIFGSSSAVGQGDTAEPPTYNWGYLARLLANDVGHMKMAAASTTAAQWRATYRRQAALISFLRPSHAIVQLGANDWNSDTSLATIQANLGFMFSLLAGMGIRVIGQTYTPINASGLGPATRDAVRKELNAWIRTNPSPLWGHLDATGFVESNSTLPDALTVDGTHLSPTGHALVARELRARGMLGKLKLII